MPPRSETELHILLVLSSVLGMILPVASGAFRLWWRRRQSCPRQSCSLGDTFFFAGNGAIDSIVMPSFVPVVLT